MVKTKRITSHKRLKDIAPEVFVTGYPPLCSKQPTIVSDEEANEAIRKGLQVMTFPNEELDGIPQRKYICNHEKSIYPGLRTNPLSNNSVLPFLPCCYAKNQKDTTGSKYRQYFMGETTNATTARQKTIITTNKLLDSGAFGTLPTDLENIFGKDSKYLNGSEIGKQEFIIMCY